MLLLIIYQLLWFLYRGLFTVGISVLHGHSLSSIYALTDYSYISARDGFGNGALIARCLTGVAPNSTYNGVLGGLYFNGTMIPNSGEQSLCYSDVIQVRPEANIAGVINIHQCGAFSTSVEGVYTCTMMNSSVMYQSIRFGIYLNRRSESLEIMQRPEQKPT